MVTHAHILSRVRAPRVRAPRYIVVVTSVVVRPRGARPPRVSAEPTTPNLRAQRYTPIWSEHTSGSRPPILNEDAPTSLIETFSGVVLKAVH